MKYIPNSIPFKHRLRNIISSLFLLVYGGYGIYINDLYLPGKRTDTHLHDEPALIMYGAFICGCLVMMSVVIDHYDKRNNEQKYQRFAEVFKYTGWIFFIFSLLWHIIKTYN